MKFAHLADCHIGGWREPRLRDVNSKSFVLAVDTCLSERVDFVLISGDLFNTAVPGIDSLRMAVEQLKRVKDAGIPVYFIAGSHDFSLSGKTMLDVLEFAGLAVNVAQGDVLPDGRLKLKFTVDGKTGTKIVGLIGKKGGLEKNYFHFLAREFLDVVGPKVFLFHSAISEMKPKDLEDMDSMPVSLLPAGFDYYAGGHVHVVDRQSIGSHQNVVFPGPIFPNNFSEVEKLRNGSFVIVEDWNIKHVPLVVHPVVCVSVDGSLKSVGEVEALVRDSLAKHAVSNAIVTVRVFGCLGSGRPADLRWNDVFHDAYARGAFFVMKNSNGLSSKELDVIMISESNVEDVESSLIKEHASQFKLSGDDVELSKRLMNVLSAEKLEGERINDFEARLHSELDKLLG